MALLFCIFAVEKINKHCKKMNRYFKPYDCDLKEYEARLASSREIWDDYSHEWSYSTFDEKLVILAGFVLKGGDLKRAIERYAEERRQIVEQLKERGFAGTLYFYLKKNVMNYNDGTFCWYLEGNFHPGEYQTLIESRFKQPLRDFFWYEGRFYRYFLTYSQLMWLFTLLLIPVTALYAFVNRDDEYRSQTGVIILTIIGATLFVMLFEGRARYLLNLAPIYVLAASLSLDVTLKKSND